MFSCPGSLLLHRLSPCGASGGYSLGMVQRLLIVVAPSATEHGFQSVQISVAVARGLGSACSVVVAHELSCRWNLPRPGIESGSSAQAVRLSTTGASGESQEGVYDPLQPAGLHPWYSLNVITYSLPSCSLHT